MERRAFQKDLRARITFLKEEGYKKLLNRATAVFAYGIAEGGGQRLRELLDWTRKEMALTHEPGWLSNLFLFTQLPEGVPDPKQLFLEPVWFRPFDEENPVSLLKNSALFTASKQ